MDLTTVFRTIFIQNKPFYIFIIVEKQIQKNKTNLFTQKRQFRWNLPQYTHTKKKPAKAPWALLYLVWQKKSTITKHKQWKNIKTHTLGASIHILFNVKIILFFLIILLFFYHKSNKIYLKKAVNNERKKSVCLLNSFYNFFFVKLFCTLQKREKVPLLKKKNLWKKKLNHWIWQGICKTVLSTAII